MTLPRFRQFLSVLLLIAPPGMAPVANAQSTSPAPRTPSSLDQQLLDDLNSDLLEDLDNLPTPTLPAKPATGPTDKQPETTPAQTPSDLDQQLLEQLGGEDIEPGKPIDPLSDIGQRMRIVETLIARQDTSEETQRLQSEIIDELARLIEQLQRRGSAGGQSASRAPRSSSSQQSLAKSQSNQDGQTGDQPAADSTTRVGKNEEIRTETPNAQNLLKAVWGHLPERVRQEVQNASVEQFLPKYEKLIEDYYKRLAEDRQTYP
jgi:hypothetical protein